MTVHLSFLLKSARFSDGKLDKEIRHSNEPKFKGEFQNPVIEGLCEKIVTATNHKLREQAAYDYRENKILLLLKKQYPTPSHYYYDLSHEIAHARDYLDRTPGAMKLFMITEIYNMALNSQTFKDILAPNTDALIDKFYIGGKFQDIEKTLLCTYIREEYKAD
ncbi:MAG: hypothetical protein LBP51_00145, partial [Deferribacteraceae bacterium]|nr:hypothetical protein [Deferribacteraceae bacterium]